MLIDYHILLLSITQGLTEFLPVSSSGHLILFAKYSGLGDLGLGVDVAVHLGSILAVIIYFSDVIWDMIKGLWKNRFLPNFKDKGCRLFYLIVIGTIPVIFAGLALKFYGMDWLRSEKIVGWNMLCFAFVLYFADRIGMTIKKVDHLGVLDALAIGCAQCLSLIPGTSRSGITITFGRFLGLERKEAAKFSMLLSIPSILAAASLVFYEIYRASDWQVLITSVDAVTYSFIASIFAIYIMMWWLKKSTFLPFVIYRICLGSYLLLSFYGYL